MKPKTPDRPLDEIGPRDRLQLLAALEAHPGFHLFCERQATMIEQDIEAKIFDPATPDDECRVLRQTRRRLVESFTPEKILRNLYVATESEVKRQEDELERARKTQRERDAR